MTPGIRTFGLRKVDEQMGVFERELERLRKTQDEEPVHKLRVSIRRLQQALRVFGQFVDSKASKRIRGDLRGLMKLAGSVREHDICLQLITEAKLPPEEVTEEREIGRRKLEKAAAKFSTNDWRERLGIAG